MGKKFKVVAASSPLRLALQDGNSFFVREFDKPDKPMPWEGDDPEMMIAALVTKWGMLPVTGRPEIDEDEYLVLDGPKKNDDGAEEWEPIEVAPYVRPETAKKGSDEDGSTEDNAEPAS